ncbi:GNAT family N-acetyltransferase [Rhodomicrobium sp. Az07]|uniref:GNAT family N-acetyltransferase n=1 Tax=Rhodomicrobium sp. Az07 TaxID=2839034 RepID=UPI001BE6C82A|nr:GNAT family N-acetyltransferase [Rhodomicrobium sp. Az07]MBT3070781.1 GNAT family N-acetyltransferase [Rhodomicrobium sp. Az07]
MEFAVLGRGDEERLEQLIAIYRVSIARAEQKPEWMVRAMLGDSSRRLLVAIDNDRVIAFAICYFAPDDSFWLLEYLAVDSNERSGGVGGKTYAAARALAAEVAPGAPCLLEVDAPPTDAPDSDEARRRLSFYRRFGCRRVDGLIYALPFGLPGEVPPMWLLVDGLKGQDAVSPGVVATWLRGIYAGVYAQSPKHSMIGAMMQPLEGKEAVRLTAL